MNILGEIFNLRKHSSNIRTELLAGLTTFITMAYILAVNPIILSKTGMGDSSNLLCNIKIVCLKNQRIKLAYYSLIIHVLDKINITHG